MKPLITSFFCLCATFLLLYSLVRPREFAAVVLETIFSAVSFPTFCRAS